MSVSENPIFVAEHHLCSWPVEEIQEYLEHHLIAPLESLLHSRHRLHRGNWSFAIEVGLCPRHEDQQPVIALDRRPGLVHPLYAQQCLAAFHTADPDLPPNLTRFDLDRVLHLSFTIDNDASQIGYAMVAFYSNYAADDYFFAMSALRDLQLCLRDLWSSHDIAYNLWHLENHAICGPLLKPLRIIDSENALVCFPDPAPHIPPRHQPSNRPDRDSLG